MLTIFAIPKPFKGHINIIQRNAIKSWLQLYPKCQVILFGDDEGVAEAAAEFGVLHIPEIEKTEFGTPLLNSAFNSAQKLAKNQTLLYLNADNILMDDVIPAIKLVKAPLFLMSGQRWDVEIKEEIKFNESGWEKELRNFVNKNGRLHGPAGMDYCVFPRNLPSILKIPALAVGRIGWDNWLIYRIRSFKIPMIDATGMITIIHQNHDYSHSPFREKGRIGGPESQRNLKLAGGFSHLCTLRDADWVLTPQGLKKPSYPQRLLVNLSLFYPWRLILALKRKLCFFGLSLL